MVKASDRFIYEFEDFCLDPEHLMLYRNGQRVALTPKQVETLLALIEGEGEIVSKDVLMDRLWGETAVEEANLIQNIHNIRKTLGETADGKPMIETLRRRGYRFNAEFKERNRKQTEPAKSNLGHETGAHLSLVGAAKDKIPSVSKSRAVFAVGIIGAAIVVALIGFSGYLKSASAGTPKSILVLPGAPMTPSDRNDRYALGIADSLINRLSSAEGIVVRSLSPVLEYAETTIDPLAVGHEKKTDYVLASTYQVADGKIRITAQLYNVKSGAVEYTLQTQTSTTDLFAAQDEIAADFGNRLMQRFGVSSLRSVKPRGTDNEEAYFAYLQGMILLDNWTSDKKDSPLESFDRAVSLDPNYAAAWAGKALAHSSAGSPDNDRGGEYYKDAQEAIDRALYLDPNESLAYTALCHQRLFYEWNYAGAEEAGRRAVELDQTSPFARYEYAMVLTARGRANEAVDLLKKAIEMEPTSVSAQEYYANALYMARRFREAETQYKVVIDLKPQRRATYWWMVCTMEVQGKETDAVEWTVKLMAIENKGDEAIQRYRAAYERGGYKEALRERINSGLMKGHAYLLLGDKDKTFELLEEQYRRHFYHLAVFGIVDPKFDPLRGDPRWADLVRRVEAGGN